MSTSFSVFLLSLQKVLVVALLLLLLTSCSPFTLVNTISQKNPEISIQTVAYGPNKRHQLDLYSPKESSFDSPLIVFFYGGSWKRGDKSMYRFVGHSLSNLGYSVAIPNYRLYPEIRFPGFVDDAALAVSWLFQNTEVADNGIILLGHSAGAHTSALLSLDHSYLDKYDFPRQTLKGMIGLAGPYAFKPWEFRSTRAIFPNGENRDDARPITFACIEKNNVTPIYLLHGEADDIVVPENSQVLYGKLRGCGAPIQYREYDDVNHIDILLGLSKSFQFLAPILEDVEKILKKTGES